MTYYNLVNHTLTSASQSVSTFSGRKFSDYGMLAFAIKLGNYWRNTVMIPSDSFYSSSTMQYAVEISFLAGGQMYFVDFVKTSETSVTVSTSYGTPSQIYVQIIALVNG